MLNLTQPFYFIAATGSGSEPVADYIPDLKVSALNQEIDPVTFDTSALPTKANYHIQIPEVQGQAKTLIVDFPYKAVVKGIRIQGSDSIDKKFGFWAFGLSDLGAILGDILSGSGLVML